MKKVILKIEGMKCEGCVNRIKNVLENIKGIINYDISLENKTLIIEVKKDKIINEVISKIENLDFQVEIIK